MFGTMLGVLRCWLLSICGALILTGAALANENTGETTTEDWRKSLPTFRFGVVLNDQDATVRRRLTLIRDQLQQALGVPVELIIKSDYASLMEMQRQGWLHYAIYSTSAFSALHLICECVEPVIAPLSQDGGSSFRSVLISRSDVAIATNALPGQTIAYAGRGSVAGHLVPRLQFLSDHPELTSAINFEVTDQAETASESLREGKIGAFFGWSSLAGDEAQGYSRGSLRHLRSIADEGQVEYVVLWKSIAIPHGPHAVIKAVPGEARKIIASYMLALNGSSPHLYDALDQRFGGGFAIVSMTEYEPFIDLVRRAKDLPPGDLLSSSNK
ncbi:MAG: PhnD/SsuA/transferrin family substrate-binding protein [Pseudomonadota bacterium]